MNTERINCFHCRYFFVTWDQRAPNGCKAYGFKSKEHPSMVVRQAAGEVCAAFSRKTSSDPSPPEK